MANCFASFAGQDARPDLEAFVSSGLLDESCGAMTAFEAGGVEGLGDVHHVVMYVTLSCLKAATPHPIAEQKIRSVGRTLGFCLENSLDFCEEIGWSTGASATGICASLSSLSLSLSYTHLYRSQSTLATYFLLAAVPLILLTDSAWLSTGCGIFGRDEGGSDFAFTQSQVDQLCANHGRAYTSLQFVSCGT